MARFGLGHQPGRPALSEGDIKDALLAELDAPPATMASTANLPDTASALAEQLAFQRSKHRDRLSRADASEMTPAVPADGMAKKAERAAPVDTVPAARIFRAEAQARFASAMSADLGLRERLVWFWSNHFAISAKKSALVRITAGAFEREAIRPFVTGRFADMLVAATRHPAMLTYLDNRLSIGPTSRAGQNRNRGLNENHAREILELHTLGVDGGYRQADVTALAKILTGWTVAGPNADETERGRFTFNGRAHEPGEHVVMGRRYRTEGVQQGLDALRDLAHHPATARHVARKLARHFVADTPPPALVEALTARFIQTDGDLAAVTRTLLAHAASWTEARTKIRSPQEFLIAALRATGTGGDFRPVFGMLSDLGQPLWQPSGPNGFADTADVWASPDGLKTRLDIAAGLGQRAQVQSSVLDVVDAVLGPLASRETRQAVSRAESRAQGFAILLMSPEFQRR
jgi:uncharacterized protein (DUF1800 family)